MASRLLSLRDAAELRWAVCDSASAIGLRSSLGAQLERAHARLGPSTVDPSEVGDIDMEAVARLTRVVRALARCTVAERAALTNYYAADAVLPASQRRAIEAMGLLGPVMLLTPALLAWARAQSTDRGVAFALESLRLRATTKGPGAARAVEVLAKVRSEADALLARACASYVETSTLVRESVS